MAMPVRAAGRQLRAEIIVDTEGVQEGGRTARAGGADGGSGDRAGWRSPVPAADFAPPDGILILSVPAARS